MSSIITSRCPERSYASSKNLFKLRLPIAKLSPVMASILEVDSYGLLGLRKTMEEVLRGLAIYKILHMQRSKLIIDRSWCKIERKITMMQVFRRPVFFKNLIIVFAYFFWISDLFCVDNQDSLPHINIPFIDCSLENVAGRNAGVRPIGVDGINFEQRQLGEKQVFFNTGHGGSGVCLAPGCAQEAIRRFESMYEDFDKNEPIAVCGAGYSALFITKFLLEKNYTVKIYAEKLPERDFMHKGEPCITSLVAAGFWKPYGMGTQDKDLYEVLASASWNYYNEQISSLPGISMRDVYEVSDEDPVQDPLLINLLGKSERVNISMGEHNHYTPAWHYRTLLIDGNLLVNDLYEKLQLLGVLFITRKFENEADIQVLNEKIIFNCFGLGSKLLFGDNIMPASGQLMYLKDKEFPYFLRGYIDGQLVAFYPGSRGTTIGLSRKDGDDTHGIDSETQEMLRIRAQEFINQLCGQCIS